VVRSLFMVKLANSGRDQIFYTFMKLGHAAFVYRHSRVWLAFYSRMCCVLLLCSSFLSLHNDCRVHALSPVERGMSGAPVSDGTDALNCGDLQSGNDLILPGGSDNDPFLVFLSLRAACVPSFSPFVQNERFLSETGANRVRFSPPDAGPPHLHILARSAQLLC
jgi:hypothetical protein